MYQSAKEIANKAGSKAAAVGVAATLMVGQAHAALPAEVTAAFTGLSDNTTALLALIWPILATVAGGFALMTLFKKGTSKAV